MASELQRAALVVERSRGAVQAMFREARLGKTVDAAGFQPLVDDITASVMRNPGALISLARLKTQDDYSYMHSVAVCALMVALAHEYGFEEGACRQAGLAGLMHDIGKVTIPVEVLTKPGRLSPEEWLVVRAHPEAGHAMLLEARGAGPAVLDVCLHHHEKMDGSGYPQRLSGEEISLLARMGAVCDVYDAITSDRAYKAGWEPAHAIAQMSSWKGHFDPAVFALFVKCVGIYPVGSLVRLASGRLAVVTEHHTASVLAPKVRVFFSTKSNMPIPTEEIDLSRPGASDRIVARESRSKWGFDHLESLWGVSSVGR
jgi:HD-GYP domain-containing protein (c-di-GMP phosphodiesterase class II)